jgi:hypothetical protein
MAGPGYFEAFVVAPGTAGTPSLFDFSIKDF